MANPRVSSTSIAARIAPAFQPCPPSSAVQTAITGMQRAERGSPSKANPKQARHPAIEGQTIASRRKKKTIESW